MLKRYRTKNKKCNSLANSASDLCRSSTAVKLRRQNVVPDDFFRINDIEFLVGRCFNDFRVGNIFSILSSTLNYLNMPRSGCS